PTCPRSNSTPGAPARAGRHGAMRRRILQCRRRRLRLLSRHPRHWNVPRRAKEKAVSNKTTTVNSASDARIANNTLRHQYRVLSDAEKELMEEIKDKGQEFLDLTGELPQGREVSIARTK